MSVRLVICTAVWTRGLAISFLASFKCLVAHFYILKVLLRSTVAESLSVWFTRPSLSHSPSLKFATKWLGWLHCTDLQHSQLQTPCTHSAECSPFKPRTSFARNSLFHMQLIFVLCVREYLMNARELVFHKRVLSCPSSFPGPFTLRHCYWHPCIENWHILQKH